LKSVTEQRTIPDVIGVYHGWKNIGMTEAVIINMRERLYDYERPDALDLPWDSEMARRIIPYTW
jgi:dTDP-4-dehydrorhamnose 3,5-epimerase